MELNLKTITSFVLSFIIVTFGAMAFILIGGAEYVEVGSLIFWRNLAIAGGLMIIVIILVDIVRRINR